MFIKITDPNTKIIKYLNSEQIISLEMVYKGIEFVHTKICLTDGTAIAEEKPADIIKQLGK